MNDRQTPVTADRLLGGRVALQQPADGYRAAIDPVLLAAAAPDTGGRVLDIGCGVGAAAICLATRRSDCRVTGLEIQPDLAELAGKNAAGNGLIDRVEIVTGDLLDPPVGLLTPPYDGAIVNPPYQNAGQTAPPDGSKATSHIEGPAGLGDWIGFAGKALKHKGWLVLIHRADRLDEICAALHPAFAEVRILPLWPKSGTAAKRIIVRARKGIRSPAALLPGLVLHGEDGGFTAEAEAILRDGAALPL